MIFHPCHPGEVLKDYLGEMTVKEAEDFKKLVDKNGLPIFVKAVFPPKKPDDSDKPDGR